MPTATYTEGLCNNVGHRYLTISNNYFMSIFVTGYSVGVSKQLVIVILTITIMCHNYVAIYCVNMFDRVLLTVWVLTRIAKLVK